MDPGAFSISLSVKDLQASRSFYEKLGFSVFAGQEAHNYLIMKSGPALIGLFQGMFEKNILTFNPGWDQDAKGVPAFTDVREIHEKLRASGINILRDSLESASGPGSFVIEDPDGNPILFDQHV